MAEPNSVSAVELLRRQQQRENINTVAAVIKAAVHKHYPGAVFEEMAEYDTACNVAGVRFGAADTGRDGSVRPPYAMAAFYIGSQDTVDSEEMEKSRRALASDLHTLFGAASNSPQFDPSAGSMILQGRCTGTAIAYGAPAALHAAMQQAMENCPELHYLLPRGQKPR